jgi:threonine/homoserine/homoserine lactone efflux protein
LVILVTPGPAVIDIVTRSLGQGRAAGVFSVLSIEVGNFIPVLSVTIGLSAVLFKTEAVFIIIKILGAMYLVSLGIRKIFSNESVLSPNRFPNQGLGKIFRRGLRITIFNPTAALFLLAFSPQLVDTTKSTATIPLFTLGCSFVILAIISDGIYSMIAGTAGNWLKGNTKAVKIEKFIMGCMYVVLGITAALMGDYTK